MTLTYALATRNAQLSSLAARVDAGPSGGTVKVYSGVRPVNPDTAPAGTLLLTFTFAATAFDGPVGGSMDVDSLPLSAAGAATGTATWFRCADSTGAAVFDGEAGTAGSADIQLSTASITPGLVVNLTGGTMTHPA